MNGQWVGRYEGSNKGRLFLNLDDVGSHYTGPAFAYDDNASLPSTFSYLVVPKRALPFRDEIPLDPINPQTGLVESWERVSQFFPSITFPKKADIELSTDEQNALVIKWKTDIGTEGFATLPKSKSTEASERTPLEEVNCWSDFKRYVNDLDHRRFIFRGQQKPYRLRTSFHRTGRADLGRFVGEDIQTLYRHLSSRTTHIFDLSVPDQNGAFFNLVQHHGYPTPLLDWTYSPYVAAFFAHRIFLLIGT
jgi:hypothetical protein